jgi:hypothetical protein
MTEVCRAGFVRFVTLRTGWLRSPFMRLVLPLAQHGGKQSRCHRQSPIKAANEAGCEQARVLSGGHMGKQWACVPKFGRSLAHQELRRCSRPLIRSPAKMGRHRCDKKANENGESYRPEVRKINNSTIR